MFIFNKFFNFFIALSENCESESKNTWVESYYPFC